MEANRIRALLQAVKQGRSHHRLIHSDTTFSSTNSFDDLLQFDNSEFDMFNIPTIPSLQLLSPLLVASDEIDETVVMDIIDSLSPLTPSVEAKRIQAENISEQLAIAERKTASMIARNNELKRQLAAKKQELQETLAHNEKLKEEIRYYMEENRRMDAEMADDPDYAELLAKFTSQLALRNQFPNPSSKL